MKKIFLLFSLILIFSETFGAFSLSWDNPWTVPIGNDKTSIRTATIVFPSNGNFVMDWSFTGDISVSELLLTVNGQAIHTRPFLVGGSSGSIGLFKSPITNNTVVKFEIVTSSDNYCDAGNLNLVFETVIGQAVANINTSISVYSTHSTHFLVNESTESEITALISCNDFLRLHATTDQCNPNYKLLVSEVDPNNDFNVIPSTSVERHLTSSEISSLLNPGPGIVLNSFSDPNRTINFFVDNYYLITLVDVTQGWVPHYRRIHMKPWFYDMYFENSNKVFSGSQQANDRAQYFAQEPYNKFDDDIFSSPALWNKLSTTSDPNSREHEYPDYVTPAIPPSFNTNKMFFEVRTLGCGIQALVTNSVRMFWTRARTDELWDDHWLYDIQNNSVESAISPLPPQPPLFVPAGSEITISGATASSPYNTNSNPVLTPPLITYYSLPWSLGVNWYPPNPIHFGPKNGSMNGATNRPVICLLARLNEMNSIDDPIVFEPSMPTKILPYVKNNNNVATRNTLLYDDQTFYVSHNNGGNTWDYGFGTVMVNNGSSSPRPVSLCIDLVSETQNNETFHDYGTIDIGVTQGVQNLWASGGAQMTNLAGDGPTLFHMTSGTHGCLDNIILPPNFNENELIGLRFNYNGLNLPNSPRNFVYRLSMVDQEGNTGSNTMFEVGVPSSSSNKRAVDKIITPDNVSSIKIYPNPASNQITLERINNLETKSTIKVYTLLGELMENYDWVSSSKKKILDTQNWSPGSYVIEITSESAAPIIQKIIIAK